MGFDGKACWTTNKAQAKWRDQRTEVAQLLLAELDPMPSVQRELLITHRGDSMMQLNRSNELAPKGRQPHIFNLIKVAPCGFEHLETTYDERPQQWCDFPGLSAINPTISLRWWCLTARVVGHAGLTFAQNETLHCKWIVFWSLCDIHDELRLGHSLAGQVLITQLRSELFSHIPYQSECVKSRGST